MTLSTTGLRLDADAAVDLHLHTTYSDGRWAPEALLDHLLGEKFDLAAVTDHDRADTVDTIQQLARERNLPVLVAVEISSEWKGELVDLLCYGFDPNRSALRDIALDAFRRQQENSREVYENLQRLSEIGGDELFWQGLASGDAIDGHLQRLREQAEVFEQRITKVTDRRDSALTRIKNRQNEIEYLFEEIELLKGLREEGHDQE